MDPNVGRAAFRIAVFMVFTTLILLPFLDRGSAEFSISILTLVIGLTFIGVIALFVRHRSR